MSLIPILTIYWNKAALDKNYKFAKSSKRNICASVLPKVYAANLIKGASQSVFLRGMAALGYHLTIPAKTS